MARHEQDAPTDPTATSGDGDSATTTSGQRYLTAPTTWPAAGSVIGRFEVVRVLGHGGEGVVLAARDPLLDRPVALKLVRPERRGARDHLLAEGKAIARLRHPNVVTVYDVGLHDADLFIAMEQIDGSNLRGWLAETRRPWRAVLACLVQAGRGLAAAHAAGLVHGDFKPENVLVDRDGRVVVSDFGLARLAHGAEQAVRPPDDAPVTSTIPVAGTPAYLAPEQWAGGLGDARADGFAFCVTLHEACYGHRPFEAAGAPPLPLAVLAEAVQAGRRVPVVDRRGVPRHVAKVIDRGLASDPGARFASMDALLRALAPRRRRAWLAAAGGAAVLAAVGVAVVAGGATSQDDPRARRAAACAADARRVETAWSADTRAAYVRRGAAVPWAAEHAAWLDTYAQRWAAASAAACRDDAADPAATRPCLERALAALSAATADDPAPWPRLLSLTDCAAPAPAPRAQAPAMPFTAQSEAVLSPDRREVAVTTYDGDVVVVALDVPYAPRPVAGAWAVLGWLADGRLYTLDRDLRLQLRDRDGTITDVDQLTGFVPQPSRIAPDGRRYTIELDERLEIHAHPGRALLATLPGVANGAWSPDGRRLVGALLNGDLVIHDLARGTTTTLPVRTPTGAVGVRQIAWLAANQLVLPGEFGAGDRSALWSVTLADDDRLAEPPTLRLVPTDGLLYHPLDSRDGRLALKRYSAQKRIFERDAGVVHELPGRFNDADLRGVDPDHGLVLATRGDEAFLFDAATRVETAVGVVGPTPVLRDGAAAALRPAGDGRWAVHERRPEQAARVVQTFAWPDEEAGLICSQGGSRRGRQRCLVHSRRGGQLAYAALDAHGPGPTWLADNVSGPPALTADGRVVVPRWDAVVEELDLATGRSLRRHTVGGPTCSALRAGWLHDEAGVWAVVACPAGYTLVAVTAAGTAELAAIDGWISGVVSRADDRLLYSVVDLDPRLFIVDGL